MGKVIGYMVTWTTYGTWLQGSKRGYVKDGEVHGESEGLRQANKDAQTDRRFILTEENRELVRKAILEEAEILKQEVYAIAISTTHVHLVLGTNNELIETAIARYKRVATKAIRETGFMGKVWTKGYDKRYCFNEGALKTRIEYVNKHSR